MNVTTDMQSINNLPTVNPFSNKIINNRLLIPSRKLNNELYLNIKYFIKKKYEGKTIKYGYISKIYRLIKYENNYVEINNLDCNPFFFVKFSARVCNPIINTIIITKITKMNKNFIVSENGPITCITKYSSINDNKFSIDDEKNVIEKKTNTKIDINKYVKVLVQAKRMYSNDTNIVILGYILNIASSKEIINNFEKKNRTENITENIVDEINEETIDIMSDEGESSEEEEEEEETIDFSENKKSDNFINL
jgi:hypothetical protein